jgi:hypothetical protein
MALHRRSPESHKQLLIDALERAKDSNYLDSNGCRALSALYARGSGPLPWYDRVVLTQEMKDAGFWRDE